MKLAILAIISLLLACGDPYEEGLKAYEAERWKEAIEHFQRVSTWSPHKQDVIDKIKTAYFRVGQRAYEKEKWQEALEYLRKIKAKDPQYAEAQDLIGCTFYRKIGRAHV